MKRVTAGKTRPEDGTKPRLSLGPIPFYWSTARVMEYYDSVADSAVDIVYLGETVCAKRREMKAAHWLDIGKRLQAHGKSVVLSGLALIEAASELGALRRCCETSPFLIEANDMAAVFRLGKLGRRFVGGSSLNVYNPRSLACLLKSGLQRLVTNVELSGSALQALRRSFPGVALEIMVWGYLPLAYSARCFTARAENRQKDQCEFICIQDPNGRLVHTREGEPVLRLNGIQTLSARTQCLAAHADTLRELGAEVWRIMPQAEHSLCVVDVFDQLRRQVLDPDQAVSILGQYTDVDLCDGYWSGDPGFQFSRKRRA